MADAPAPLPPPRPQQVAVKPERTVPPPRQTARSYGRPPTANKMLAEHTG